MRFGTTTLQSAVICAVAVASLYIAQPLLEEIGSDLGAATNKLGWFASAGHLRYLVGLVLLVPLGDLLNRKHPIIAHLGLVAIGLAVAAVAPSPWMMLCSLGFTALFAVVVQTTVAHAAAASVPGQRGRNLGPRLIAGTLAAFGGGAACTPPLRSSPPCSISPCRPPTSATSTYGQPATQTGLRRPQLTPPLDGPA